MKVESAKLKDFFLKQNGDLKSWVVMAIYVWLLMLAVWLAVELIGGY